jgi:hypothetical protein
MRRKFAALLEDIQINEIDLCAARFLKFRGARRNALVFSNGLLK